MSVVIIGAGPAGLTAAYMLSKQGVTATVLEADSVVGGISRTVERDGWRFDIGGHRFFTKVTPVDDLWFEILGPDEFLQRPRMSRILYQGKLYDYPLVPMNALRNLGPVEAVRCVGSYAWAQVQPAEGPDQPRGLLRRRFGWRLYEHFFKTYTEKVWGVPATEMHGRLRRPAGRRTCRSCAPGIDALTPKAHQGAAGQGRSRPRASSSSSTTRSTARARCGRRPPRSSATRARRSSSTPRSRGVAPRRRPRGRGRPPRPTACRARVRVLARDLVDADGRAAPGDGPAGAAPRCVAAADGLTYRDFITVALVVPAGVLVPRQLDLHPRSRRRASGASRTSARGRRTS